MSILKINVNISMLMPDGINGLINPSSVGEIAIRGVLVSAVFILVFVSSAAMVIKKRDVK